MRQFTDVNQAGAFGADIQEDTEGLNAYNCAFDRHVFFDVAPLEIERFDHGQFDTTVFYTAYPNVNVLSFLQDVLDALDGLVISSCDL